MVKVTLNNNDAFTANTVNFAHVDFETAINFFRQDARAMTINREDKYAEIKHEVRGQFGWETRTVTVQQLH